MEYNEFFDGERGTSKTTPREVLYKYLAYLPLFILSLLVCIGAGLLYSRYTAPLYRASAKFLVKGDDKSSGNSSAQNDLIENALYGGKRVNMDNEIELIRSQSLMETVVAKNNFNINYYYEGNIKAINLYKDFPLQFVPVFIKDSLQTYNIFLEALNSEGGILHYTEKDAGRPFRYNQEIQANGCRFILRKKTAAVDASNRYRVAWRPIQEAAGSIISTLTAAIYLKTTMIQLSILSDNVSLGKDILNALITEYNNASIQEKTVVSNNTIAFINDRLRLVTGELSGVESNLEVYRGVNQVIDVEKQSAIYFENTTQVENSLQQLGIQQKVAQMLYDYISQPVNVNRTVPSSLGLEDPTLAGLVGKYNELQLAKVRETPMVTGNSMMLDDISNQIEEVRKSMLENLRNISKNIGVQAADLRARGGKNQAFLSSLPKKERALQEIKRQQGVQEGLYLYLLQKREEAAISSASTISNYKQVDRAVGSGLPVVPNTTNIMTMAALLGFLLPVGYVFLKDLMNNKVTLKTDITKATETPVIGEVAHFKQKERKLVVGANDRSILAEQFRIVRTNLQFIIKDLEHPVVMVTSTVAGEGKTFCSMNLAAVWALTGKKTVIVELDLRKPKISRALNLDSSKGITSYIVGKHTAAELPVPIPGAENLFLVPAGTIPPNPAELLLDAKMDLLFAYLKEQFEFIIIDTAPVGLVSDAKILGRYSAATIYIVRRGQTFKRQLEHINDLYLQKTLPNMSLLVNDVKVGGAYSYYGHGYGYGYGDSYNYGYNYTYGGSKPGIWKRIRERLRG